LLRQLINRPLEGGCFVLDGVHEGIINKIFDV